VKRNMNQTGGLEGLLGALQRGNHSRYVEDPSRLGQADTVTDGNAILSHLLGSKEVSRQVAGHAASNTGIDAGILKQMLPIVATLVMGAMSKQAANSARPGFERDAPAGDVQQSPLGGLLNAFLDTNKDGSIVDDVLGMFFKR